MRDRAYKNSCAQKVIFSRQQLQTDLRQLGFEVGDSHGNFLLGTVPSQSSAEKLYLDLKEKGILVRYFDRSGLTDKLRITVGTDDQNRLLIQFLTELIK